MKAIKSKTDIFWNERAKSVRDDIEVNIIDIFQRELEYNHVCHHLTEDMTVLEVGCGNGFSTARFRELVRWIDAIDYAKDMIKRAIADVGETNNRFIHDNILYPKNMDGPYDAVICIRVLINLRNLEEQHLAVDNMARLIKPEGFLILVEGYRDGFLALSEFRGKIGIPPVVPAEINYYSSLDEVMPALQKYFNVKESFHLGTYDYLTRVVYPMIVGADNVTHNTVFSEKCSELAQQYNPDEFECFSRIRGFVLEKRP